VLKYATSLITHVYK